MILNKGAHPLQGWSRRRVVNSSSSIVLRSSQLRHSSVSPGRKQVNRLLPTYQTPVLSRPSLQSCHSTGSSDSALGTVPSPDPDTTSIAEASDATWQPEELQRLADVYHDAMDDVLGTQWRGLFEDDVDQLADYVERDEETWQTAGAMVVDYVAAKKDIPEDLAALADSFSPAYVNHILGMGTWRIRGALDPAIALLAQRIEGTWREAFEDDLTLYPRDKWKTKYDICDSIDPNRELEGWSYADVPFPEPGSEDYPRLLIENRVYCSRVFRKLHIELAYRQDGLQVLHCVMYPRYAYDLPILAMDLVVSAGRVTLAIVDACPVRRNKQIPAHYLQTMLELQQAFLTDADNQRRIPDWGQAIFSPACVCIRPESQEEVVGFLRYTVALTRAHCALSTLVEPLKHGLPGHSARLQDLLAGHKSFCDNQLANKKTSRVLETAFGKEWTDAYMRDMMFDFCPDNEAPYEDASLNQLFRYYEENPEVGSRPEEWARLKTEVELKRAEEVLSNLSEGQPVRQDRVEDALRVLYELDDEFADNCLTLMPELAGMECDEVAAVLVTRLPSLGLPQPLPRWTDQAKGPTMEAISRPADDDDE